MSAIALALTAGMALVLVLALTYDLSKPQQLVGVILLALMTAFFGWISLALWAGIRRATLRVDAGGLTLPRVTKAEQARPAERVPWTELGQCFVFVAEDQKTATTPGSVVGLLVRGETRHGLVLTDRAQGVLSAFIAPAWGPDVVLGLAARVFAQTGRQLTIIHTERLPLPGELGPTLSPAEARAWQLS